MTVDIAAQLRNISVIIVMLAAFPQLINIDHKLRIWLLFGQYLGVFLLIQGIWPLKLTAAFLLSGWMGTAVMGMALMGTSAIPEGAHSIADEEQSNPLIALLVGLIVILLSSSTAFTLSEWIPSLPIQQIGSALLLIGFGIVQITIYQQIFATSTALLTILAGFEILLSGLTSSIFVVGMLGGITLLIALSGVYWMFNESTQGHGS